MIRHSREEYQLANNENNEPPVQIVRRTIAKLEQLAEKAAEAGDTGTELAALSKVIEAAYLLHGAL